MAIIDNIELATETWDEKLLRLSSLTISTEMYNHWGVDPNIGISGYLTSIVADAKQILIDHGCEERVNGDGSITKIWPSEESKISANAAVVAYVNARSSNVYVTADSGNVYPLSITFEDYVENFISNTRISLTP